MTVSSEFAGSQIARLQRDLTSRIRQTLRTARVGAVHDLRVAIRKFDQALIVFEPLLDRKCVRRARRKLKKIMALAGAVRNCDVADDLLNVADDLLKGRFRRAGSMIRTQRAEATTALAAALDSWIDEGYPAKLRHRLRIDCPGRALNVGLSRMTEDFVRYGEKAVRRGSPAALHRFRIAAKHYRYTLDLLAPLVGRPATKRHIKLVKAVQSRLGNVNDCETVRRMAAEWFANAAIDKYLEKTERAEMSRFRAEWTRRFADPKFAQRWAEELRIARHAG